MADYAFYTDEFGMDDTGIHLLRNRFRYQSFRYEELQQVRVGEGPDIQNWAVVLAFGVVFLGVGLWGCYALYWFFTQGEGSIDYRLVVVPFFPLVLGALAVVSALRRTAVLEIRDHHRKRRVSLREVERNGRLPRLLTYLASRHETLEVAPAIHRRWQA